MSTTAAAPVNKGLEGVIAGETAICNVEQSALNYRGYEIADLKATGTLEAQLDNMQTREQLYNMVGYKPGTPWEFPA